MKQASFLLTTKSISSIIIPRQKGGGQNMKIHCIDEVAAD
mgnify:CR=1 FL=1